MSPLLASFLLSLMVCFRFMGHVDVVAKPTTSPSSSNLIKKACQNSADKRFCINLIRSDHTSPKADMKGLTFIALNNVEKNAAATSLSIKVTLDNPETDMEPDVQDALNDCNEHYMTLIDLVEDSVNALVSDVPSDVTKFMKAVVADVDSCDAILKGQGGAASQVAARNQDLRKFINNALSVFQVFQSTIR